VTIRRDNRDGKNVRIRWRGLIEAAPRPPENAHGASQRGGTVSDPNSIDVGSDAPFRARPDHLREFLGGVAMALGSVAESVTNGDFNGAAIDASNAVEWALSAADAAAE
jgi:hypothetical protein